MKKLIIKNEKTQIVIDNPTFIPQMYSSIVTQEFNRARVKDIEFNYTTEEVTVLVETYTDGKPN